MDPRILDFLDNIKLQGRPGALLGEPGFSLEALLKTRWPELQVVHLDCTFPRSEGELEDFFRRGIQPATAFLLTLTDWAPARVYELMEQLLVDGEVNLAGERLKAAPDARLVLHSRSGLFAYHELVPLRLAVP